MTTLLYPRVKPTLHLLQRTNGSIYIGTANEGFELDPDPYLLLLRRCTGRATVVEIATELHEEPQVIARYLEQLRTLGIIENQPPAHVRSESSLSRARQEIEMVLASHRSDDGGEIEWRARANFSVLITGDTRIARNLLPLLAASGFLRASLISEGHASVQLEMRDLNALTVTIDDLGKNKASHHRELIRKSQIGNLRTEIKGVPQLIIATSPPRPDEIQRWQSEQIAHIAVGALIGCDVEISPLVRPGTTPCLQCIALHKRDALPDDLHPLTYNISEAGNAEFELPVGPAALIAAHLVAIAIDHSWRTLSRDRGRLGAHGPEGPEGPIDCHRISRVINLLEPIAAPRERRWNFHPECGCVDVRRRALPR
jgi:hypothetical protein